MNYSHVQQQDSSTQSHVFQSYPIPTHLPIRYFRKSKLKLINSVTKSIYFRSLVTVSTCLFSIHQLKLIHSNTHLQLPHSLPFQIQNPPKTMAKALNLIPTSTFPPFSCPRIPTRKLFSVRASTESPETPTSSSASVQTKPEEKPEPLTFSPPPNFKPPEPKRFGVRPDKTWDVLGASLALFFRLGTGVFVSGYS